MNTKNMDIMGDSATLTVRLKTAVKERLEAMATSTRRSKSFLAAEAIEEFVELNEWQIARTQKAIEEAPIVIDLELGPESVRDVISDPDDI